MSKIKLIFYLILVYILYKGVIAVKDFELGLGKKIAEIENLEFPSSLDKAIEYAKTQMELVK